MTDIEKKLQSLLFNISEIITQTRSPKRLYDLYTEIQHIISMAEKMNYNITIPPLLFSVVDINSNRNDVLSDKLYDGASKLLFNDMTLETDAVIQGMGAVLEEKYNIYYQKGRSVNFTVNEAFNFAERFFEYLDKDMFKHFKYMVDNERIQILNIQRIEDDNRHGELHGFSVSLPSQRQSFVVVSGKHNIDFVSTIIHEIMHSYISNFEYDYSFEERFQKYYNCMWEVMPYFTEHLFQQYLKDINYDKKAIELLETSKCNSLIGWLYSFNNVDREYEYYEFPTFASIKATAYGKLLAFHYFDEYLKNPEKTIDNVLNLTLDSKDYEADYLLNNYGLTEEQITDFSKIEKRLSKHYGY